MGKTDVSEEAKEVLNLGKKFRLHTKLKIIATKTKIEKGLTILRWKQNTSEEEAVFKIFVENQENNNLEEKVVDFSMTKATGIKFTRRLYAPNAAPEKLESNQQQTREALENVFKRYKKKELMRKVT